MARSSKRGQGTQKPVRQKTASAKPKETEGADKSSESSSKRPATQALTVVEQAIGEIRTAYALGGEIRRWIDQERAKTIGGTGYAAELNRRAREHFAPAHPGLLTSEDKVRKLRQFADAYSNLTKPGAFRRGFDESEINEICDLARGHLHRLSLTALLRLLRIADPEDRHDLAIKMVQNKWSVTDVTKAVKRLRHDEDRSGGGRPVRRSVGRRLKRPATAGEIMSEFVELATRWVNYADHVDGDPLMNDIPDDQRAAIETLTRSIRSRAKEIGCDSAAVNRYKSK